eukprot:1017518-Pleurochrysis_carterae.AAC.4
MCACAGRPATESTQSCPLVPDPQHARPLALQRATCDDCLARAVRATANLILFSATCAPVVRGLRPQNVVARVQRFAVELEGHLLAAVHAGTKTTVRGELPWARAARGRRGFLPRPNTCKKRNQKRMRRRKRVVYLEGE